jgi:hypothetical protein
MRAFLSTRYGSMAAALGLFAGCSFIQDYDLEQCEKDRDCGKRGAGYANHVCVENLCRPFLSCSSDAQCQSRGGNLAKYICNDDMQCVAPDCETHEDCQEDGERPTASCTAGRCGDPAWGCLRLEKPPPNSMPTIKFTTTVQDLVTGKAPPGMQAFVCANSDKPCTDPIAGPYQATDAAGNISFSISGLSTAGFGGFIKFTAPGELPLEFQFVKTPLERDFVSPPSTPFAMLKPRTMEMFGALVGKEVNEANSSLLVMRVFDCEGKPAAGVRLELANTANDAFFFTSDSTYMPDVDATATDGTGVAGLANVPAPGIPTVNVIHAESGHKLYDFKMTSNPATFVLVFIYAKDLRL